MNYFQFDVARHMDYELKKQTEKDIGYSIEVDEIEYEKVMNFYEMYKVRHFDKFKKEYNIF